MVWGFKRDMTKGEIVGNQALVRVGVPNAQVVERMAEAAGAGHVWQPVGLHELGGELARNGAETLVQRFAF